LDSSHLPPKGGKMASRGEASGKSEGGSHA